jgi:RNA polymerase-binding transcription factor DksA
VRSPTPAESTPGSDPAADLREHLPALRTALIQQRRVRTEQLSALRTAVPAAPAQEEVVETLRRGARIALAGIEAALLRMNHGTYGSCVRCAAPIPLERLEILPAVALCMTCQRAQDAP